MSAAERMRRAATTIEARRGKMATYHVTVFQ
jgi:hypothetical protein